jgi:phosphohistidine swiveling domain-containing protein
MAKQKTILKGTPMFKNFSVLKKVPYRTFYRMPEKLIGVPMFYTIFFNYKPLRVKNFVNLFLSSPKKYEKKGVEGIQKTIENLRKIEDFYKNSWPSLNREEKIAFGFILLHAYFTSWREDSIYEIMIDCPPPGFNVESFIPKNKLEILGEIKKKCTKVYERVDLYDILKKLMNGLKKTVLTNRELVKKKYQKEIETIFQFKNFYELMQNSVLQLLYKHPGIFRFKQPTPKIFLKNVEYTSSPKRYLTFPIEKRGSDELKGVGASVGITKGKVKICHWVENAFKKIKKGDILVCPKTDPSWVPILGKVSGVITEGGGLLSHAAIVSRELKIPCIVGVAKVFDKVEDNYLIEMNGETGEIKILKK